ncbi:MAG: serine hydrolase domain-containing protein [Lysobacter sp.]
MTAVKTLAAAALALATLQSAQAATPARVQAGMDAIFAEWNHRDTPGCGVAVFQDDAIVFQQGYGMANLELDVPIGAQTVFDIGSTSKQFTATAIMLLVQDGKLSLDDDIRKHLPEMPDYGRVITVRHLLQHTSGIRDYLALLLLGGVAFDDYSSDQQAMDALVRQKSLNFQPGDEFVYSNSGYFLAAQIVKRVSGQSLGEFAGQRIFTPLGMRDTLFRNDHTRTVRNRASAYSRASHESGTPTPTGLAAWRLDQPNWDQVGDGAVHTTLADLQRWDRNFYRPQVGDAAMLAQMQTVGTLNNGEKLDYGLGLMMDEYRGVATVSHGGAWGGYRSELLRVPQRHWSVAVACNFAQADTAALSQRVADLWLDLAPNTQAEAAPAPARRASVTLSANALRRWAGVYRNPKTGSMRQLRFEHGRLSLHAFGDTFDLRPVARDEFAVEGGPIAGLAMREGGANQPRVATQIGGGKRTEFFAIDVATPDAAQLAAYAGSYRCDELARDYRFDVADGALRQLDPREAPTRLDPLERDRFLQGSLSFRFLRGTDGAIDAVSMNAGRVRDLTCARR